MSTPEVKTATDFEDDFDETEKDKVPTQKEQVKKVFSRDQVIRAIPVKVHLPRLYPDYDPWEFSLRLKLSKDAETRRNEYAALSASQQQVKLNEQNLDELCDLMIDLPKGFGDLQETGKSPGETFKDYVNLTVDADAKMLLYKIVEGAVTVYWNTVMPREFRQ